VRSSREDTGAGGGDFSSRLLTVWLRELLLEREPRDTSPVRRHLAGMNTGRRRSDDLAAPHLPLNIIQKG
jgi:hypothetical protein